MTPTNPSATTIDPTPIHFVNGEPRSGPGEPHETAVFPSSRAAVGKGEGAALEGSSRRDS